MDRKQFLGTLVALPMGIFLVHCSSDSSPSSSSSGGTGGGASAGAASTDPNAPGAPATQSGGMDVYTSSVAGAHTHTFTMADSAISAPPTDGVSGDSSTDASHSHTVAISADQLTSVGMGESVEVTSGVTSSHSHVFTFVKIG
jgi:hypothetical protein